MRTPDTRTTRPLTEANRLIVLSTISSDAHTWNLVYLQLLLEEHGFDVVNLGPCVPDEHILGAIRRHRPCAVVLSTVNGHGYLDGSRLIKKIRNTPEGLETPVFIGGKLGILGEDNVVYADRLITDGFDAVLVDSSPEALIRRLSERSTGSPPRGAASAARRLGS
ncbi:cobalamin B12-binding domain-containing protein [Streptomyces gilvosporeus]|uniref:cobalamin B12-binding domain-containing protein n=1 Tax=Streptomyces gilvosporeus TaxID=553510 RepID=UPI001F16C515|nr:cobalamin B12-binding domain-containing protein [Streptomyces gilvosporeus]